MSITKTAALFFAGFFTISSFSASAADIYSDSFESADYSTTNSQGFRWTDSAWTSLVNETHEVWLNSSSVSNTKENASSFPGVDWTPRVGNHSMRFRYSAGESWSEQRFNLGTPMKDVWIRLWIRVPVNFSYGPTGNVNKLFAIWSDGYSFHGDGSTVWLGMERTNSIDANVWFSYSAGGNTTSGSSQQTKPFITSADRGRWMHLLMHFKTESTPGSSDGVVETYRRWESESEYTKLHEIRNAAIKVPAAGPNGFKEGYILGWHQPYTDNTEWFIDDFTVSDAPPMGFLLSNLPNAPILAVQ